jgi:hypothetical protein
MAGADLTVVRDALHEHFTGKTLVDIFFTADKEIAPIMAAMDAQADTGEGFGRKLITPIVFGTGTSVGADLAKVQAKAASATVGASGLYGRWEQDPVTVSATAQWSREAMDAAIGKSTVETFKVMSKEMDLKIVATRNMWARLASGDGTGALGIIAAAGAGGSAAANWIRVGTDCINRFSRGMDLSVAATGGTGACRVTTGGTGQDHLGVLGTLPDGTVYLDGNPVSSASSRDPWVVGDVVFNYNNRAAGALTYVLPQGLKAWLPGGAVVDSSPFNGFTRNGISELAGLAVDCSSLEPEDAFLKTLKVLKNMASVKASALFCSDNDYTAFVAGKDKSKIVEIALGQYNIGFKGMTINSLAGDVPVIADSTLPDGEFYAGPWKDAELRPRLVYTGDLVQIDNRDGLDFRLVPGTAAYQMQLYSRGNIAFPAPGKFVRGYGLSIS